MGQQLSQLVVRVVEQMTGDLGRRPLSDTQARKVFKCVFWLLAGKILRDKRVPKFVKLDLSEPTGVFTRVAEHYGVASGLPPNGPRWNAALTDAAQGIQSFASLANVSTEALAYLYENTLVDRAVRKQLGTHSTPGYLVDYMLWQLAAWIEEIPEKDRYVFEPACGHGAFLVGAMRMLRLMMGETDDTRRRQYLRTHLRGIEVDEFALEIAKLSLTLADTPNPNGWRVSSEDMFSSDILTCEAGKARILLANPPHERFAAADRIRYEKAGFELSARTKAVEMLARTLPHLPPGAVFGVVVPQGMLHSKEATSIREFLANKCDLSEVCLFPDKIFSFSDMETAIFLGRRRKLQRATVASIRFRRVRESGMEAFKEKYAVNWDRLVSRARFDNTRNPRLTVPEWDEGWSYLSRHDTLRSIATMGQGLFYKGAPSLPMDAITVSTCRFAGAVPGFDEVNRDLCIYGLPLRKWLNLDSSVIDREVTGTGRIPQVLLNYARVSRGPWRLKAMIDVDGHAVTSRFLTVRPVDPGTPLEFLWAILNSPLANAFAYAHSMKRNILTGTMRRMPVPNASPRDVQRVVDAARGYLAVTKEPDAYRLRAESDEDVVRQALLHMDAEVLRLYDLPPRLERELLDLFAGHERKGVGCGFDRYFPDGFTPYVPLHEYISDEYRRSTVGEVLKRFKPAESPEVLVALRHAADAFGEE